jgi:hypothetical protein
VVGLAGYEEKPAIAPVGSAQVPSLNKVPRSRLLGTVDVRRPQKHCRSDELSGFRQSGNIIGKIRCHARINLLESPGTSGYSRN